MASLIEKARIAVLGQLHALLDSVTNTPEAYKQRIRDLQGALASLRAARDESVGATTGLDREITKKEGKRAKAQADIDLLLGDNDPSNDEAALELQLKMDGFDTNLTLLKEQKAQSEATTSELSEAIEKLEAKHEEMSNGLTTLTLTAAATSAKNRAADAAEDALGAAGNAGDIDSIQARINSENDTANARFERVFDGMKEGKSPEEQARLVRAKQALEARRSQIASAVTK